jgi:Flp pilus assembly protein TadB
MPTQSSPPRSYSFAPLFRGSYSDQHLRVSDAERQAVADRLAENYADGRLDQAEFDERAGRAMSAKTRADLSGLLDDLPEPKAQATQGSHGTPGSQGTPGLPRRRRPRSFLVLVLIVIVALVAAHAVMPWLWLGLLVAAVLFAARGVRHSHPDQH